MIVDVAHYVRGNRETQTLGLDEAAACPRSGSSFVWIAETRARAQVALSIHTFPR